MLFANVCAGFVDCCCKVCGQRRLLAILGAPSAAGLPLHVYMIRATQVCLSLDTPVGGGRWRHYLRSLWEFTGFHSTVLGKLREVVVTSLT